MEKRQTVNVRDMVEMALFTAIIVVLASTPLGYIPITPAIGATTMHIPVIIAGVVLGWKKGAITGFLFGLTSFLRASFFAPGITSFLFTPLQPGGNFWSLVICFIPRILIGVVSAFVFKALVKVIKNETGSLAIAGLCGSMTNTILVMGMTYIFFSKQFAEAVGQEVGTVLNYIIGSVIVTNGIPEAIVAAIITTAVGKALLVVIRKRNLE